MRRMGRGFFVSIGIVFNLFILMLVFLITGVK